MSEESDSLVKRRGRPPKRSLDSKFGPRPGSTGPQHIHPNFKAEEPTKPWTREDAQPWRMDMFRLQMKRPGFVARFVSPAKVESKLMQGWTVADPKHYGGLNQMYPGEGQEPGGKIKRREMILMELPIDRSEARAKYYDDMVNQRERSIKRQLQNEIDKVTKGTGHTVEVTGDVKGDDL